MTLYYLAECSGEYDDYRQDHVEFSDDENYLQDKANKYNAAVAKAKELLDSEGKIKAQNKVIEARNQQKRKEAEIKFLEQFLQSNPIPDQLKSLVSFDLRNGNLRIPYHIDINYMVLEVQNRARAEKFLNL